MPQRTIVEQAVSAWPMVHSVCVSPPTVKGNTQGCPHQAPPLCHKNQPPEDTRSLSSRPNCWRRHYRPDQPRWRTSGRRSENLVWKWKSWPQKVTFQSDSFLLDCKSPGAFVVSLILVGERENTFCTSLGRASSWSSKRKLARSKTKEDMHKENLLRWHLEGDWLDLRRDGSKNIFIDGRIYFNLLRKSWHLFCIELKLIAWFDIWHGLLVWWNPKLFGKY